MTTDELIEIVEGDVALCLSKFTGDPDGASKAAVAMIRASAEFYGEREGLAHFELIMDAITETVGAKLLRS